MGIYLPNLKLHCKPLALPGRWARLFVLNISVLALLVVEILPLDTPVTEIDRIYENEIAVNSNKLFSKTFVILQFHGNQGLYSEDISAFIAPDGHYKFDSMPFGLADAPTTFERKYIELRAGYLSSYGKSLIISCALTCVKCLSINWLAFFLSWTQPCCSAKLAIPIELEGSSCRSRKAQHASITFDICRPTAKIIIVCLWELLLIDAELLKLFCQKLQFFFRHYHS